MHAILIVMAIWLMPAVLAEEPTPNPYCTDSTEQLMERFDNQLMSLKSLWEVRAMLREEARLFFDCWTNVRDQR